MVLNVKNVKFSSLYAVERINKKYLDVTECLRLA